MGPGLFLAVVLAAATVRAEIPVGLDAQGVDPMAAVDNRLGLDVRDELGRPVSGRTVLAELKKAAVRRAAEASFASSLPKARLVLPALESGADARAWLVQLFDSLPRPQTWSSLPVPRPRFPALALVVLGVVLADVSARFCRRPQQASSCSRQCRPEVLRC